MPSRIRLSKSERLFIEEGIRENVRSDGRGRLEFRHFGLVAGVIPQANGSCRFHMGGTEILVGVRCELGEIQNLHLKQQKQDVFASSKKNSSSSLRHHQDSTTTDEITTTVSSSSCNGRLSISVSCSPSAANSEQHESNSDRERLELTLTQFMTRILTSNNVLNWESLNISSTQCWVIVIEVMVLESGGNLVDAVSIATLAALRDTKVPQISVVEGTKGKSDQIEVTDDPRNYTVLDTTNVPVAVSLLRVGTFCIADPSVEEEICVSSRLTVAVNSRGNVCGMQKAGRCCGLHPKDTISMLTGAAEIANAVLKHLDTLMEQDEEEMKQNIDNDETICNSSFGFR